MSTDAADELRVLLDHGPHVWLVGALNGIDLSEQDQTCMVEQPGNDGGSLDQPDFRKRGARDGLTRVQVRHRMHGAGDPFIPSVGHILQAQPLVMAVLKRLPCDVGISRDRRTVVADLRDNVQDLVRPIFLSPRFGFR